MALSNKNMISLSMGSLLMVYLYLGTPVPANIILHNVSLALSVIFSIVMFFSLCSKINIFVAILFALVAFEVINKSLHPQLSNINKNIQYYNNTESNKNTILSDKLKSSDTLEQDMVSNMNTIIGNNHLNRVPTYQPLLADSAGSSQVE